MFEDPLSNFVELASLLSNVMAERLEHINLVSLRIRDGKYNLYFGFGRFWAVFWPYLAPRPVPTGRARNMMQNAPAIRPGGQF